MIEEDSIEFSGEASATPGQGGQFVESVGASGLFLPRLAAKFPELLTGGDGLGTRVPFRIREKRCSFEQHQDVVAASHGGSDDMGAATLDEGVSPSVGRMKARHV